MGNKELNIASIDKRRWLVLVLQILVGTASAYVYCLTVYIGPLYEQFGWDPSVTILIWTVMMFVALPGSVIGGWLNSRFGSKFVLKVVGIAFGAFVVLSSFATSAMMYVVLSSGACLMMQIIYVSQMANVGCLFPDKRGLSIGIFAGATAAGTAAIAPLAEYLTRAMDLMHGIALQGIIYGLLIFICGFLIVEAPEGYRPQNWVEKVPEENVETAAGVGYTWKQTISKLSFWLLFLGIGLGTCLINALSGNMSLITQTAIGVSPAVGAWFYSLWQICCAVGGILLGFVSDKWLGPVRTFVMMLAVCAVAALSLSMIGVNIYGLYLVVICVLALAAGGVLSLIPNIALTLYGEKSFGVNYGILAFAGTIAALIGTQVSTRNAPSMLFMIGGGFFAVGTVFLLLATLRAKSEHSK